MVLPFLGIGLESATTPGDFYETSRLDRNIFYGHTFFALAACTGISGEMNQTAVDQTNTPVPTSANDVNEAVNGEILRTYVYLIALEDNGQSGEKVGCNDSVIPVVVEIEPTTAPLSAALETLLSIDDQYYGRSGLYNVFYQSDLSVDSVDIHNGEAIVHLTGEMQVGGVCDSPRVKAQLEQTALQYQTVDSVTITLNGESLESLLSGQ
jgi:hypothetical protein